MILILVSHEVKSSILVLLHIEITGKFECVTSRSADWHCTT